MLQRCHSANGMLRLHETSLCSQSNCEIAVEDTGMISPFMRKTGFLHKRKTKTQISCAVTAQLISAFVFATRIIQALYYLNPKFQASSHLLWLYSPVCVGPGRKPQRPVFSKRGSHNVIRPMLSGRFSSS